MSRFASFVTAVLPLLAVAVSGHMTMTSPAPFLYKGNPNSLSANIDYDYSKPLSASGSDFPCKGHHKVIGTAEGKAVDSWAAGSSQTFVIEGGAAHGGGSCQASISEDGGATFKVIKSFIGNCPVGGQSMPITVPSDTKSGDVIFAWSWFNMIGNREMYMNCAPITVTGGGSGLSAYPDMFTANIGNGCTVAEGTNVEFPNPGSDVARSGTGTAPSGSCGASSGTAPVVSSSAAAVVGPTSTDAATETTIESDVPTTTAVVAPSQSATRSGKPSRAKPTASSVPEASPSYEAEPDVPICQRSVRYTRSAPVEVQPGCHCSCENNIPKRAVLGSSL